MASRPPPARRSAPLPPSEVWVICRACGQELDRLDANTRSLAAVIQDTRRRHATTAHGWHGTSRAARQKTQ